MISRLRGQLLTRDPEGIVEVETPGGVVYEAEVPLTVLQRMPAPGAPKQVLDMYKEDYEITSGPEGLYMHPPRKPGWGLDLQVVRVVS
ncbi:MAG: hypothetical protein KY433_11780 [Actinobacteria bacterium]|nr:hypothetical protein [Actinomycetota bacterium]